MRDRIDRLIVTALSHLACVPEGLPLLAAASREGLFPTSRAGKEAAELCQQRELITPVSAASRARRITERYTLSTNGRAFLQSKLNELLAHLTPLVDDWKSDVLTYLHRRHETNALEDCPLPMLFELSRGVRVDLTIGEFHDGLRDLLEREQIYLHPWTGPLYDLPEPALALLVGHEIMYYASFRFAPEESYRPLESFSGRETNTAEVMP